MNTHLNVKQEWAALMCSSSNAPQMLKFSSSLHALCPLPSRCAMSGWNEGGGPHSVTRTHSRNYSSCRSPLCPPLTHSRHLKGPVQTMNCGHFWYKRCMWSRCQPWVLYAWRLPCFPLASEKSGWSAVTTEPFADPRPMSQSPAPIRHFARSLRQLTKREPSVRYLMSQTQLPILLTTNFFFFVIWDSSVSVFFYTWPFVAVSSIFVHVWGCRKSHHPHSTACARSPIIIAVLSSALYSSGPNPWFVQ